MRKRFLLISTIVVLSMVGLVACGKKSASSESTTETTEATEEDVSTVATEEVTEATTKATTETTTATKEDENKKAKTASGTYNGFGDSNSVEIKLDNGEFKTFIVEDEDVMNALNDMEPGTKITFTYGAMEGQANSQILSVKKK